MPTLEPWMIVLQKLNAIETASLDHHDELVDDDFTEEEVIRGLKEAAEYGYVRFTECSTLSGKSFEDIELTVRGRDSLKPDGGETAKQNTVIISFQNNEIIDLLDTHLKRSAAPESQRRRLIEQLRALPAELLKTTALTIWGYCLGQTSDVVDALQNALNSVMNLVKK